MVSKNRRARSRSRCTRFRIGRVSVYFHHSAWWVYFSDLAMVALVVIVISVSVSSPLQNVLRRVVANRPTAISPPGQVYATAPTNG